MGVVEGMLGGRSASVPAKRIGMAVMWGLNPGVHHFDDSRQVPEGKENGIEQTAQ